VRFNVPQNIFLGKGVRIGEGSVIEARALKAKIEIGDNVQVSRFCTIKAGEGNVKLGQEVLVGQFSWLEGWGGLKIGDYTLIGPHVVVLTSCYDFEDTSLPIKTQELRIGKVIIGKDVWLGTHVVVLPGVKIGQGAIIGAGAVVSKDIEENCVAVGVPAKVIRKRGEKKR